MNMEGDDVKVIGPGGENTNAWKELSKQGESQQDVDENESPGREYIKAPYNPLALAQLSERSETHAACVNAKARHVAGFGFDIVRHQNAEEEEPPGHDSIHDFWFSLDSTFQLGPDKQPASPTSVLESAWWDYEGIGWLALEVIFNESNTPVGLAHIPAHSVRRLKNNKGYVQLKENGMVDEYFGIAGNRANEGIFVDNDTGEVGENTGEVGTVANELIVLRNYTPLNVFYGTPDIISALQTLEADLAARKFNANFFDNDTVPRMAVIVENGELTERAWKDLKSQFQQLKVDNNSHRAIILESADAIIDEFGEQYNVNIRIEPLTVGIEEDASFIEFRKENEHDILKAHEVPPVIANRVQDSNYANSEAQRLIFAEDTVQPKQQRFASRLYNIIHASLFDVKGWTIEFNLHGADQDLKEAQTARERIEASKGTLTVNEARDELGYEPFTDEYESVGNMLLSEIESAGGPVSGLIDEDAVEALQDAVRSDERAKTSGYDLVDRIEAK